jgi:DNA mismatch repair protein MutS
VGKLAGLPPTVVERARAILKTLEADAAGQRAAEPRLAAPATAEMPQLGLFGGAGTGPAPRASQQPMAATRSTDARADEVVAALRAVDPDELSPRAAWDLVNALIKKLTPPPND